MRGKNISIIETVALGMDKRLHLIKAGKQYVLIASTSKSVEFLTAVDLDENESGQNTETQIGSNVFDFKSLFEKYTGIYKNKRENLISSPENKTVHSGTEVHDFKSNLGRLRSIIGDNTYQVKENGVDTTNEK